MVVKVNLNGCPFSWDTLVGNRHRFSSRSAIARGLWRGIIRKSDASAFRMIGLKHLAISELGAVQRSSLFFIAILLILTIATRGYSQNSSLFQRPELINPNSSQAATQELNSEGNVPRETLPPPLLDSTTLNPMQSASWTYVPNSTARKLKIHDIVSIRVDEIAQSTAQGNASSRKNATYDARLADWVRLDRLDLKPAPQTDGDPRIQGQENEVYRADSTMRTRESLTFNIAAEIADIKPNGNIVLSAQKTMTVNDNAFEVSLSGFCRAEDIGPDNTILSRNIFDLHITKNDRGHVRDGYSRGWLTRFIARIKPF